ncbi:MAG: hypothetical protein NC187_06405 [Candidatus Amulumruptor caecigallinarius]|nr:hypothetical protein [Candidatus Amulumruptor caecigallinarius]MCM1397102.1 hypothetical protein [Candidatus Amulumruptor caecigallinarius]MCM1454088.1 hypothetical protein [bacterium]
MLIRNCMIALATLAAPASLMAQTAVEAMQISRDELRGTARFMSMGGAFGALGGDLSTLSHNPAGLGIYRSSEVGVTLDIDIMSTKGESALSSETQNHTRAYCPNFGYVGSWKTGSELMPYFNWGVTYGRVRNYNRRYRALMPMDGTSLSNHVASYSGGYTGDELYSGDYLNPYIGSNAPWMSILMYNGAEINPTSTDTYMGLAEQGYTTGSAGVYVDQRGYMDEYSINFGGNFVNKVYWGIGIGIIDVDMDRYTSYGESLDDANVPYQTNSGLGVRPGIADYTLDSYNHVWGTGVNVKLGVIVKPINELRLGLAVHTPTWYSLSSESSASVIGDFSTTMSDGTVNRLRTDTYTNDGILDYFEWSLKSPWRFSVSAAGVIGTKAIISAEYEYRPYQSMRLSLPDGWDVNVANDDAKNYYQATNTLRLGAEYRVTPAFSLRAGYSYVSAPAKGSDEVNSLLANPDTRIDTDGFYDTGTTPSFRMDDSTNYITCGLGYRYQMFYIDAAYVYRSHKSTFYSWSSSQAPTASLTDHDSNIVLTAGLRF